MNTMSSIFAAAPMALGLTLAGCGSNPVCGDKNYDLVTDKDPCATMGTGGTGGTGGAGGSGGTGGVGGGMLIPGSEYAPKPLLPSDAAGLAPTPVFVLWTSPSIPTGKNLSGFQLCLEKAPASSITGDTACPNSANIADRFSVFDSLAVSASYSWKVRSLFAGGDFSSWSAIRTFTTDSSLVGWWRADGNTDDTSGLSHALSLKNGAKYGAGKLKQDLVFDGVDDEATAAPAADLNFGSKDFSLSAWVNPQRDGQAEALITKRTASNGFEVYRATGGQLAFYGSGCGIAAMGGSLPKNVWSHVVASRSSGTVRLYVNGAIAASGTCADDFTNTGSLALGCNGPDIGCVEPFQGGLDEVVVRKVDSDLVAVLNAFCSGETAAGTNPLPSLCVP